jgi:regulator of sigma E protease
MDVQDPLTGETVTAGRIGARPSPGDVTQNYVGVGAAFTLALSQTGQMAGSIAQTLRGLIQRQVSLRELGGPIMIARESANAAQRGMRSLLVLLALLSINLAVLNLLPIPVLDGGQIVIILAEAVKGSPFSPRARQFILGTGVALVLLLMLVVSYNDILRLFRS